MKTLEQARNLLRTRCSATSDPELTDDELDACLEQHKRPENTDYSEVYDLGGATRAAWELKAAKVAERINFSTDGKRFEREALHKHCLTMASRYSSAWVA